MFFFFTRGETKNILFLQCLDPSSNGGTLILFFDFPSSCCERNSKWREQFWKEISSSDIRFRHTAIFLFFQKLET